ncbi:V-type ATPase, V0 complex, 116kDa subunit family [Thamnocephalis sphaerospora]|uniref:V-type proton ATPase subunit a n=1 Tax=Thamnocephalis sphaerospora TaxID=78915 RepID=A0A4P9XU55_9FUNG|nr:V-type ATPase, V0 complex, 116kDa subunit family [Thamnocephalis sphaerospora]|eukprot:RKP09745.1 V-type ATPase, V0 complex, 116kDa subunit family [Thamnocephalis sphaerospora]
MSLVQLFIPLEGAPAAVSELGELGLLEFRDLNPDVNAFQRSFVSEIRRLDEMERKLRFLSAQIEKADISVRPLPQTAYLARSRSAQEVHELEMALNMHESRVLEMNSSYESLLRRSLELTEQRHVLERTAAFFEQAETRQADIRRSFEESDTPLLQAQLNLEAGGDVHRVHLGFVTGVIARSRLPTFERVMWRALRGNLYMNHVEIEEPIVDPATEEQVPKSVFIIFAHGREILAMIRKISEALGGTLYPVDSNPEMRRDSLMNVAGRLSDVNSVLQNTSHTRRAELLQVAEQLTTWLTVVKKEKAVYHTMNMFNYDGNQKCLIAEGWCPTNAIGAIHGALRAATENINSMTPTVLSKLTTSKTPPTYHRTNKFTAAFQDIVDAYGMARYGEVNPGLFTIISFPFLFALMFGDLGHGAIMTAFAVWMCVRERSLAKYANDEMFGMIYSGRYIILLMGFFSMYAGMLYNDIFSRSMHFWHSGWDWGEIKEGEEAQATQVGVYPFGIDPAWHGADNALLFSNSYKMKMSILIGVVQMSFGIMLTIFNHVHFKRRANIWAEFVPQMLFMQCIFGYLSVCIVYKWSVDWYAVDENGNNLYSSPPSLLNTLIFMFLQPGQVKPEDQLFAGQAVIQVTLLLIALVCVPWMLLAKPLLLKAEHERKLNNGYDTVATSAPRASEDTGNGDSSEVPVATDDHEHDEEHHEFNFADIMVDQVIHTIEFCLNCISNTASYLRLWALSLAHAQLSTVLWDMTLEPCFHMTGAMRTFAIFAGFAFWLCASVAILIAMEGMSAFLHTLRLHWVEFNSKFYIGGGRKFMPFTFAEVLEGSEAE